MPDYDILLRRGAIYDGIGSDPYRGDLTIRVNKIAAVSAINAEARPSRFRCVYQNSEPLKVGVLSATAIRRYYDIIKSQNRHSIRRNTI